MRLGIICIGLFVMGIGVSKLLYGDAASAAVGLAGGLLCVVYAAGWLAADSDGDEP